MKLYDYNDGDNISLTTDTNEVIKGILRIRSPKIVAIETSRYSTRVISTDIIIQIERDNSIL